MRRDIESELIRWKDDHYRKPLLIRGARQVGKTFSVVSFAKDHFKQHVIVNLEEHPELIACFATYEVSDIVAKIEILCQCELIPGETLLFLDEIQECPRAIVALRYFYEKMPELHVIGAGSLLEFAFNSPDFRMPVGRISFLYLQPLSFAEFLDALGHTKLRAYLEKVEPGTGVDGSIHIRLLSILKRYLMIGGMPEVVMAHASGASTETVKVLQTSINTTYQADFAKYASTAQHKYLKDVFLSVPRLVGTRCKFAHINPHVQSRELKGALELLGEARCLTRVQHTAAQGLPLAAQSNPRKFKLIFLDVGLMQRQLGLDARLLLEENLMMVNNGSVAEQLIGQELLACQHFTEERQLFFWVRDATSSKAEIDYVASLGPDVFPIEVKAGKTGTLKSLHLFLQEHPQTPFGIRFSEHELSWHPPLLSIPLYLAGQWRRLAQAVRDILVGADGE